MSNLRRDDVLRVRLVRMINGKVHAERLDINESDVRYMSTPELLRHFTGCIERCSQRLDLIEEYESEQQP